MKIFVYRAGEQAGPFTQDELRRELVRGALKPVDLAWHNRLRHWIPISAIGTAELSSKRYAEAPPPEESPHFQPSMTRRRRRSSLPQPGQSRKRQSTGLLGRLRAFFQG